MIRNLTIFAGLAATGVAQAALLGGVMRENTAGTTLLNDNAVNATVFDMYIQFDEADDILLTIGNSSVTTAGALYQDSFGSNVASGINPALFPAFATVEFDTFVGIGGPYFSDGPFGSSTDPDFGFSADGWTGGWFATPNAAGDFPGTSTFNSDLGVWEVWAGRFSVTGDFTGIDGVGNGNILTGGVGARGQDLIFDGVLDAFWADFAGDPSQQANLQFAIPAPGAAALFGLAGLTAARRRR
jgi:hypothetical protein